MDDNNIDDVDIQIGPPHLALSLREMAKRYPRPPGELIQSLRIERNLTIEELAYRSGIKLKTLINIEYNGQNVEVTQIPAIAKALEVEADTLKDGLGID